VSNYQRPQLTTGYDKQSQNTKTVKGATLAINQVSSQTVMTQKEGTQKKILAAYTTTIYPAPH